MINCSGAGFDLRRQAPPVLAGLLAAGRARPDELGLGLDVTDDGALLDAEGGSSGRLYVVGSLRKGVEWEAIGITEIRDHSGAIARRIVAAGERQEPAAAASQPRRRGADRVGGGVMAAPDLPRTTSTRRRPAR